MKLQGEHIRAVLQCSLQETGRSRTEDVLQTSSVPQLTLQKYDER